MTSQRTSDQPRYTIETWDNACGWDGPDCDFSLEEAMEIVSSKDAPARVFQGARIMWSNRNVEYESVDKHGDDWTGVFIRADLPPPHFCTAEVFGKVRRLDTSRASRSARGWSVPFARDDLYPAR